MTTKRPAGKVYKKLAVKAGVYRQTSVDPYTGQMVTETVYVSPQYLRQSAWNTMQMMQRGLDVPVCLDHQESAVPKRRNDVDGWLANEMRSSVGLLKSVKYDPASESHEYIFEVRDPEIAKKIDLGIIKRVSPNFHNEFSPGDGTRWPNVVAHLALTFRPKDGKQSPDSMEAAAVTAPGQKRFSVLTPARNSKVVIVPMHKLEFSVLRSMVRKQKNGEWHFRSTDYLFRFNSHAEFESWLKRKYTKTLRMSVAGKTNYVLYFAVVHAPVGGVHINGRLYKGGQFIPTVNLEGLDQQTRQKIQESTSQRTAARSAKAAQYRNEGEDWHQAVARHAGEHSSRPISEDDERAAARRLKSLQAHHGDQVMERIASLAGQESAQLAKLSPDDPKAEHLKRRLRAYARMAEHMQGAGKAPAQAAPTQAPAQDDSGHRNALAEMADASSDVDTAVRSRLHNEMKIELADRMKDDWQHLTDEQKAEFEQKINALPHTALGDPDEHGEYSDKETSPEAQQLIDEVNDTAYEARRSNEAKAYEQKRVDQHKKDIEEADKRGMVFERPDNHNNPGELKVNPDKVHLAETFEQRMDRIAKEREVEQKKWEEDGWLPSEESKLKELSGLDKAGQLQGTRNEKQRNEFDELRRKHQYLKSKKMLSSNTGVKKGSLKQLNMSDIDLLGQRMNEVTPLHGGNANMPVIVAKHNEKYKLLDGYGRTNGMLNAGHTKIHAIIASDADIDKFKGSISDNDEFVQYMYDKYANGLKAGSQGSVSK